jgi:hypothetical protein
MTILFLTGGIMRLGNDDDEDGYDYVTMDMRLNSKMKKSGGELRQQKYFPPKSLHRKRAQSVN